MPQQTHQSQCWTVMKVSSMSTKAQKENAYKVACDNLRQPIAKTAKHEQTKNFKNSEQALREKDIFWTIKWTLWYCIFESSSIN